MHILFVWKKIAEYIYMRRANFLLTVFGLTVSLYLASSAAQMIAHTNYYIYQTQKRLRSENYLYFQIFDVGKDRDYHKKAERFQTALREEYGEEYGTFMVMRPGYTWDGGRTERTETYFLDENILNLCNVDMELEELTETPPEGKMGCYVGANLAERCPAGTVLTGDYVGTKLYVLGSLPKGAAWLATPLLSTDKPEVILDDCIVTMMDPAYFDLAPEFIGNTYGNQFLAYTSSADLSEKKEMVAALADTEGIMLLSCYTIEEAEEEYKKDSREFRRAVGILTLFVLITAGFSYVAAAFADVYSRHHEFAVMYVNKVSSLDIFAMLLGENIVKMIIAIGISVFLYCLRLNRLETDIYKEMVLPGLLMGTFVYILVITIISFLTINRKKLLTLIGGIKL